VTRTEYHHLDAPSTGGTGEMTGFAAGAGFVLDD